MATARQRWTRGDWIGFIKKYHGAANLDELAESYGLEVGTIRSRIQTLRNKAGIELPSKPRKNGGLVPEDWEAIAQEANSILA